MQTLSYESGTHPLDSRRDLSFLLAFGFGTSVSMWGVGYLLRLPPVWMPSAGLLATLLFCQIVGGFLAVRSTGRGFAAGAGVGALSAAINLLVLGSLLGGGDGDLAKQAFVWVPGSVVLGALLSAIGGALAQRTRTRMTVPLEAPSEIEQPSASDAIALQGSAWTERFAQVAVCATLFLILVGGVVTSQEAGLAVVDWPNSFGKNMFLFPLSRMTGGVYYEHAHRLFGSLVGLTTLVLALHIQFTEPRRWMKGLGWVAVLMVITQGILGGLRVTGHFTSSADPSVTTPSLMLALVHGVFGQLFLAALVAMAVFSSRLWTAERAAKVHETARADQLLAGSFVVVVVTQLVLGAILRHTEGGLHLHLTMAVLVLILGQVVGSRGMAHYRDVPEYFRMAKVLIGLIIVQLFLGLGALFAVSLARDAAIPPTYEVVVATAHQANGAVILATSVVLALWSRRLFRTGSAT